MAHTERCIGCMYENACGYIDCRIEENKKIYEQGKQFVLDKVIRLKNEYVDTCNMCTHTKCDRCKIDEFIAELNGIISQKSEEL